MACLYQLSTNLVQNVRFAFFAEYNPVRHTSDLLTYNDKYHQEEVKDEKGNMVWFLVHLIKMLKHAEILLDMYKDQNWQLKFNSQGL